MSTRWTSAGRGLVLAASVWLLGACVVDVDLGREGFRCNSGDSCSEGLVCLDGRCVRATSPLCDTPEGRVVCTDPSGGIFLRADPPTVLADGVSRSVISSDPILDAAEDPVPDGTLLTVSATAGFIVADDASTEHDGLQVATTGAVVGFEWQTSDDPGTATLVVSSVTGTARGEVDVVAEPLSGGDPAGDIVLRAEPPAIPADGATTTRISSDIIRDALAAAVANGTLITVSTDLGSITTPDADATLDGHQIATLGGVIGFTVLSDIRAGTAAVTAASVTGTASGTLAVVFGPVPSQSAFGAVPLSVPADGQTVTQLTLTLRDGAGSLLAARTVVLSADTGSLGDVTEVSDGVYQAPLSSVQAGEVLARVESVDGVAFPLTTNVSFTNVPPTLTPPPDVAGVFPWDTIPLAASATDPNPDDTLSFFWTMRQGPAQPRFGAPPFALDASTPATRFYPSESGTFQLEVSVSDGTDLVAAQVQVTVEAFESFAPLGGVETYEVAVDPATGDLCAAADRMVLTYDVSSASWFACPLQGATAASGGSAVWAPSSAGRLQCLFGREGKDPMVGRIESVGPGPTDCTWSEVDVTVAGAVDRATELALVGDSVWVATDEGLTVIPPGAPASGGVFEFNDFGTRQSRAMAWVVEADQLFVAHQQRGYWRTPLPFDATSLRRELDPGSSDEIRDILVARPTGLATEVWFASRNDGLWLLPDVGPSEPAPTQYASTFEGQPLNDLRRGTWESLTGDLWLAANPGLVRYKRDLDVVVIVADGDSGLCPLANAVVSDGADPNGRGRVLYVACNGGVQRLAGPAP